MAKKEWNIKVIENFPDGDRSYVDAMIAKWIVNQQRERYGDEVLEIAYPIWIRAKELEETGLSYIEAKKIAIEESLGNQKA